MSSTQIPVPSFDELMIPVLNALIQLNGSGTNEEIYRRVVQLLRLDDAVLSVMHRDTGQTEVEYRLAWARTYLSQYGLIINASRGTWSIVKPIDPSSVNPKEIVRVVRAISQNNRLNTFEAEKSVKDLSAMPVGDVEGYDTGSNWPEHYPIDSVFVRRDQQAVVDVIRRINSSRYIMDPDFQRDFVWPAEKQSRLIESSLMRIPLPVFYLAEQEDGRVVVVDGLQRLTTFKLFLSNDFALRLPKNRELNGKRFNDLETKYQTRLEDCQLILYVIDPKVPEPVLLDIFDRVNSGVPLSRQQMRNCIHSGRGTAWLRTEAQTNEFIEATGGSLNTKAMRDREAINRFCGFSVLGVQHYRGNMDEFLEEALKKMNTMNTDDLDNLSIQFRRSMRNNLAIFGRHAFRKRNDRTERRSLLNIALFDVFSVLMALYDESEIAKAAPAINERFEELLLDLDFQASITLGTNQLDRVRFRFGAVNSMLRGVLNRAFAA